MGKLKDHLKRVHQKPIERQFQCTRCWTELPSKDALNEHQKLDPKCTERPGQPDERMSASMLQGLNFSRGPYANKTVEEKWKMLYMTLFPEEHVPSPYDEYGLSPDFDILLAERLQRDLLRGLIQPKGKFDERQFHEKLQRIIKECRMGKVVADMEHRPNAEIAAQKSSRASTPSDRGDSDLR
ncbi:hypothetical protein M011DRAFT_481804 [Sporormia fimetaria CBS 119925]|uniref:C2H2-type domain-containing protein n=1 Tax=Sporormia fimetaria CBS 119925 TaxID=1340428 RepID=A0A6A6UVM0_9PLEO|nr:hypothetical protein M011DRAFT_481804 [Sporormia fimetaria CBS 119925]